MIGKLRRVPLREVWRHEALDFTRWLEENIDALNEPLALNLVGADREQSVGNFSVDILAEDRDGNPVVIENQLEKSDHEHLGKLITYLTGIDAKTAVWIVSEPRPEHVSAVTWLNESSSASFYLVKVEAVQIEDSSPAPLLTLIVGPTEEGRKFGATKQELAERHQIRLRFWESLLALVKKKTRLFSGVSPTKENWIYTGAGRTGLSYNFVVRQYDAQVELYIDRGVDSQDETLAIFDQIAATRDEIEQGFGGPLNWVRAGKGRGCRIQKAITDGGYRDELRWPTIHESMIDALIKLERVMSPRIKGLKL